MKNIFALMMLALVLMVSSGIAETARDSSAHQKDMMEAQPGHNDTKSIDNQQDVTIRVIDSNTAVSIKEIVGQYLQLKNALVNDNTKDAAAASNELIIAMEKLDTNYLNPYQKKVYEDVEDGIKENAEHIGDNAGKIEHQRKHFDLLSKEMYDLVKVFGGGQVLYMDFCPMYNDKKGAIWLSESKTIKNPYFGKKMLICGSVKEEIN